MIITCEKCHTRFKVGDDKLAQGPIRVRCSKCNHVFTASAQGSLATTLPPLNSTPTTLPPATPGSASFPPFPAPGNVATAVHQPFQASSSPPARAGIFRPPATGTVTTVTGPPTYDPYNTQSPTAAATPRSLDPFGLGPTAASAPSPSPAVSDPFAGLGVSSAGARALQDESTSIEPARSLPRVPSRPPVQDPFAGLASTPPRLQRPPSQDPFAGIGSTPKLPRPPSKDPFAGIGTSPPSAAIDSARGPHQPLPDPFASAPAPDPFGVSSAPPTDPFAGLATTPPPAAGMIPQPDPFAREWSGAVDVDDADVQEHQPQSSAPFDTGDPFGSLDVPAADATSVFVHPASQPPTAPPPRDTTEISRASSSPPPSPPPAGTTGLGMRQLRRLEAGQRVKELAWAASQGVLFALFLVVAVVLARGGDLFDLGRGDVRAALGSSNRAGELTVEDVRVSRRSSASGVAVVVVTGAVRNRTDQAVPGARVEVRFDDDVKASSGWAWSTIDGVDVDGLASAEASRALSQRLPRSASLAPGDRAPFVVVGPTPAEGAKAKVVVVAASPERSP